MTFKQWLRNVFGPQPKPSRLRRVPRLEALEDRVTPAVTLTGSNIPSVSTSASAQVLPPLSACAATRSRAAGPRARARAAC